MKLYITQLKGDCSPLYVPLHTGQAGIFWEICDLSAVTTQDQEAQTERAPWESSSATFCGLAVRN